MHTHFCLREYGKAFLYRDKLRKKILMPILPIDLVGYKCYSHIMKEEENVRKRSNLRELGICLMAIGKIIKKR